MFALTCARTTLKVFSATHRHPLSKSSLRLCPYSTARRAYPRFSVYGPNCVLNMSIVPPPFTISQNNVVSLDYSKKGRLMLEWVPRNAEGSFVQGNIVRFAMSPDEVGLTVDQLPDNEVEFSRVVRGGGGNGDVTRGGESSTDVFPDKVCRMVPVEGGGVSFKLDFEMNGVGGQTYEKDDGGHITGPLEVVGQRGEVIVMRELMRSSIPALTGWSTMLNILLQNSLNSSGSGGRSGGGGGGGPVGVPF